MADDNILNENEKKTLLAIAREAIEKKALGKSLAGGPTELPEALRSRSGAFVTIHKNGMLRGCIGNFVGEGELADTVRSMAVAAGWQDPRFPSLGPGEVGEIDLEISVLSPLREISDAGEIEVGKHGIFITRGMNRGVLLPQVATEHGFGRDTFLAETCRKAGLPGDAWKDKKTVIEIFSAQVFGEKDI